MQQDKYTCTLWKHVLISNAVYQVILFQGLLDILTGAQDKKNYFTQLLCIRCKKLLLNEFLISHF